MKTILFILGLLLAVVAQTSLLPFLTIAGVVPNLVLVLILFLIVAKSFKEVWWLILLTGFFLDLFSGLPFGLISLSLTATAYLIDWFNKKVFSEIKFWVFVGLLILATLIYNLLLFGLAKLWQVEFIFGLKYLYIEIVANLFILIIFYGAKKLFYQKQIARNH